jgi:hypothetical protein
VIETVAPQVGFEPTTLRLTAECSTIELLRSVEEPTPSLHQNQAHPVKSKNRLISYNVPSTVCFAQCGTAYLCGPSTRSSTTYASNYGAAPGSLPSSLSCGTNSMAIFSANRSSAAGSKSMKHTMPAPARLETQGPMSSVWHEQDTRKKQFYKLSPDGEAFFEPAAPICDGQWLRGCGIDYGRAPSGFAARSSLTIGLQPSRHLGETVEKALGSMKTTEHPTIGESFNPREWYSAISGHTVPSPIVRDPELSSTSKRLYGSIESFSPAVEIHPRNAAPGDGEPLGVGKRCWSTGLGTQSSGAIRVPFL